MTNIELLRNLASEARMMHANQVEENETREVKPKSGFTLTLAEYPDFIVSKQGTQRVKHLICMPSADTCFIKTENKDGTTSSELLTEALFSTFSAGMPDIPLPEDFWLRRLSKGAVVGRRLVEIFKNEKLLELIRKKALPFGTDLLYIEGKYEVSPEQGALKAFTELGNLYLEFADDPKLIDLMIKETIFCKDLVDRFGIENARGFLREYKNSLMDMTSRSQRYGEGLSRGGYGSICSFEDQAAQEERNRCFSCIPRINLKFSSFRDYVLHDAFRMGFGMNISQFFHMWLDTLDMQYQLYEKIKEKYPDDLLLLHNQLSYKCACMRQKIDKRKFERQAEKASMYEGTYKGFVFIAPKKQQDLLDEAISQTNCLAGYVGKFTEGACIILFMRKKDAPERSYATVEIINQDVAQAELKRNVKLGLEEKAILCEWVAKCNNAVNNGIVPHKY